MQWITEEGFSVAADESEPKRFGLRLPDSSRNAVDEVIPSLTFRIVFVCAFWHILCLTEIIAWRRHYLCRTPGHIAHTSRNSPMFLGFLEVRE
jgi:hypothetical protein